MNLTKKGTIISIKKVANRTVEAAIKVPEDFSFIAGQYIQLFIPKLKYPDVKDGTRMFSIASSPNKKGEVDLLFRMSDSGFKKTLIEMKPGDEITFSGPRGPMKLPEDNSLPIVLIAGGVGVSSFLSMIRFSNETHSGHKITLVYANANQQEAAYQDELAQIEKENPNFKLHNILGALKESRLKESINGNIIQKPLWAVIGPQGFVDFVSNYLIKKDIPLQDIFFEQFYPSISLKND